MYFTRVPFWMRWYLKDAVWKMNDKDKTLYITFDDGPHPQITPYVLEVLQQYNARATFFCLGKNVQLLPDVYARILAEGHSTGNHTQNHLNAWKVKEKDYLNDIREAMQHINSNLFRPPYGRITPFLVRTLASPAFNMKTIMWSVLSGDFDVNKTGEQCLQDVLVRSKPGSVIVFHDSEKAKPRLEYALPKVLQYFSEKGYVFKSL